MLRNWKAQKYLYNRAYPVLPTSAHRNRTPLVDNVIPLETEKKKKLKSSRSQMNSEL